MPTKLTPADWALIAATVALIVIGQLLVKRGVVAVSGSPATVSALPRFLWRICTNFPIVLGVLAICCASLCWMIVIARVDLSVAYPFMSLTIVLVLAFSGPVFGEAVPLQRWIGVAIVCIGLVVAARA
ncbi:MAG: DMT family transporter [Thermomicrobiales bacterium]